MTWDCASNNFFCRAEALTCAENVELRAGFFEAVNSADQIERARQYEKQQRHIYGPPSSMPTLVLRVFLFRVLVPLPALEVLPASPNAAREEVGGPLDAAPERVLRRAVFDGPACITSVRRCVSSSSSSCPARRNVFKP